MCPFSTLVKSTWIYSQPRSYYFRELIQFIPVSANMCKLKVTVDIPRGSDVQYRKGGNRIG